MKLIFLLLEKSIFLSCKLKPSNFCLAETQTLKIVIYPRCVSRTCSVIPCLNHLRTTLSGQLEDKNVSYVYSDKELIVSNNR